MTTAEIDRRIAEFFRAFGSPETSRRIGWSFCFVSFWSMIIQGDFKAAGLYYALMLIFSCLGNISNKIDTFTPRNP